MKKLIFSLFMLILNINLFSQNNPWVAPFEILIEADPVLPDSSNHAQDCQHSSTEYNNYYNRFDFYLENYDIRPVTTIMINFNIWQKDDGTGNWQNNPTQLARLHSIIDHVNAIFESNCTPSDPIAGVTDLYDTKIRFEINEIYFYQNSTLWSSTSHTDLTNEIFNIDPNRLNQLNIHITGGNFYAAGFASIPSYNLAHNQYVVTFNNEADPAGDWVFGGHLAHELCHNLDLMHTYNSTICDQNNPDYLDDVFGTGSSVTCPHDAGFGCEYTLPNNSCTNNIMGGTKDACYFSPKQIAQMHRALSLKSVRKYVKCEEYNAEPINIDKNEVWDFDIKLYNPLTIKSDYTLTTKCKIVMPKLEKIVVEPNAVLIVDGGVITTDCKLWDGIYVEGTKSDYTQSVTLQGQAIFDNATIEHAKTGVRNFGLLADNSGGIDWNKTGGIIRANNSTFINNQRAVAFLYYERNTPYNTIWSDKSYFINTNFIWDDNNRFSKSNQMFSMYHVHGVRISLCNFIDNRTNPVSHWILNNSKSNAAVVSADAYYYIFNTNFTNFDFGIWAQNYATEKNIIVKKSTFTNNLYGIELVEVDYPTCLLNTFIIDDNNNHFIGVASKQYGIHAIATGKIRFEENNFYDNSTSPIRTAGIVCSDLGPVETQTYKNHFYAMDYGTVTQGLNRADDKGLHFVCNTNNGNTYRDHLVLTSLWGTPNSAYGVKDIFGTVNNPTRNTFTQLNQQYEDFYNERSFLGYYYDNSFPLEEPIQTFNVFTSYASNLDNQCETHIKPGGGTKPYVPLTATEKAIAINDFNTATANLTQKQNELNNLIDGGNTQTLLNQVSNLTPQNKFQLRQTLLSISPYVSEQVIRATIDNHPSKYPHWWAFELVLANIDVARSSDFMDFLANKQYPLPYWMRWTINWYAQNSGITPKFEKLTEISGLQTQRSLASQLLIQDFRLDTNGTKIDSIIYWTEQQHDDMYLFNKVDLLLEKGQYEQAQTILNQIDPNNLPDILKQRAIDLITLKTRIRTILVQKGNLAQMSKDDHLFFTQMAETATGSAQYQAQGILCFFFDECKPYVLDLPYGNNLKTTKPIDNDEMPEVELSFKMYPNPANEWVAIELPLDIEGAIVTIVDLNGKVILKTQTNIPMYLWTTNNIPEGIYIVNITNLDGTQKIGTQKIVIQH